MKSLSAAAIAAIWGTMGAVGTASAQSEDQAAPDQPPPAAAASDVAPAEWRALTTGKTLIYKRWGEPWGYESYAADSGAVYWRTPQGECMDGQMKVSDSSPPIYCFSWSSGSVWCGRHMRAADGSLSARDILEGGSELDPASEPHQIVGVSDKVAACAPEGMS